MGGWKENWSWQGRGWDEWGEWGERDDKDAALQRTFEDMSREVDKLTTAVGQVEEQQRAQQAQMRDVSERIMQEVMKMRAAREENQRRVSCGAPGSSSVPTGMPCLDMSSGGAQWKAAALSLGPPADFPCLGEGTARITCQECKKVPRRRGALGSQSRGAGDGMLLRARVAGLPQLSEAKRALHDTSYEL
jgi:hypothetical protein